MLLLKAPGEEAVGIARITVEEVTVIMCQPLQLPYVNIFSGYWLS